MSEPAYTKVTGAFYAPQKIEGRPVALNGKITFTPTAPVLILWCTFLSSTHWMGA